MSRAILADHARALVIELPSWQEKLHCTRVIANTQPSLIVERMRTFHLLQIDLHTQPRTLWNPNAAIFNPQRLSRKALPILPYPVRIDGGNSSWRCRGHVRHHRE